jgi:protease I
MKTLIVVAKEGFRDEEFKEPFEELINHNIEVRIASIETGKCFGKYGMIIKAGLSFDEIDIDKDIDDYSAIMIVGGPGARNLIGIDKLEQIIKAFMEKDKIISAICFAPTILAKADLIKGKKVTVWNGDEKQEPVLKEHGVNYIDEEVVQDGNLITGRDYKAATNFGKTLSEAIIEYAHQV